MRCVEETRKEHEIRLIKRSTIRFKTRTHGETVGNSVGLTVGVSVGEMVGV